MLNNSNFEKTMRIQRCVTKQQTQHTLYTSTSSLDKNNN